jgi:hypothetical protein
MRKKSSKKIPPRFKIDPSMMDKKGAFQCPECGTNISPDDYSNETYSVLDIKVKDSILNEVVLSCKKCISHIHLVGFQPLY